MAVLPPLLAAISQNNSGTIFPVELSILHPLLTTISQDNRWTILAVILAVPQPFFTAVISGDSGVVTVSMEFPVLVPLLIVL